MNHARLFLAALCATLLATSLPSATAWVPYVDEDGDSIEPIPEIMGNVTVGNHKIECDSDVLCFYTDADKKATLSTYGLQVNTEKVDEPIKFRYNRVDCQYYGEDPKDISRTTAWCANVSDLSWLDTSKWTSTGTEGDDTFARVIRNGAHALHIKSVSAAGQDVNNYELNFADITTDWQKARLIIGVELISMGVGATNWAAELAAHDTTTTGIDRFFLQNHGSALGSNAVLTNSTGIVFWDVLVTDGTNENGGVTNGIGKFKINVISEAAVSATEMYVYALALQPKRFEAGFDVDAEPVYNMTYQDCAGKARSTPLGYACLTDFSPSFAYQNIQNIEVAYVLPATALPDDSVTIIQGSNDDDVYPWVASYRFQFELPKMIDLAFVGDELVYELPVAGSQHDLVKVGGTEKTKEVEKKKAHDSVTLSQLIPTGKEYEFEARILFSEAQQDIVSGQGFAGLSPEHPVSKAWLWLLAIPGVAIIARLAVKRSARRRGAR